MLKTDLALGPAAVQVGKAALGPLDIPADARAFTLTIDSTLHTHPQVLASIAVEMKVPGDADWRVETSSARFGSTSLVDQETGKPITAFRISTDLLRGLGQEGRQVRVTVEAKEGSFTTAGGVLTIT